jgi:hypothetical protein
MPGFYHPAPTPHAYHRRGAHRALIQACVTLITVQPANNGSRWDPDRIQPGWIA